MIDSVQILPRAQADFQSLYAYIEAHSAVGAQRWREAFEAALDTLRENPSLGGLALENDLTRFELRQLLFKTRHGRRYRVVYTSLGSKVFILRLRGPGQPSLAEDELPLA